MLVQMYKLKQPFLYNLRSIAVQRDHFVRCLSVHLSVPVSVCLSGSHALLCFAGDRCIPRNAALFL